MCIRDRFRPGVMNILGNGVALDCEHLVTEMETIRAAGVSISPENLMVSHRASLLLPWHRELDALEEARLKDKMYGSTKQGIAPFYSCLLYTSFRPNSGRSANFFSSFSVE